MNYPMKNFYIEFLMLSFLICGSVNAQHAEKLLHADSLIQKQEYSQALNLLSKAVDQKSTRFELSKVYYLLGKAYLGLENYDKAIYHNKQSLSIRKDLHFEFIADNHMLFGLIEMSRHQNDNALNHFMKASELPYESIEFSGLLYAYIAQVYFRKGNIGKMLYNYKIAMEAFMTAYKETYAMDHSHYRIWRNRLYYDNFFVGYL